MVRRDLTRPLTPGRGLLLPCFAIIDRGVGRDGRSKGFHTVDLMQSFRNILTATVVIAGFGLGLAPQAMAQTQTTITEDKTVAIVNGHEIKVSEVQMAT